MIRIKRFARYLGVFIAVTALIFLLGRAAAHFGRTFPLVGGAEIGVIRIDGVILHSEKTIHQIRTLASDPEIKAILLRIDSPGGAVVPSQDIYEEVLKARKKGKIVVSSIGTVGASGAYYIASASDFIMASSGSLTGSIGVIMELAEVKDLLDKIGIHSEVVKSGKMKDVGSPFRPMTTDEKAYMKSLLENIHQQFIQAVSKGRHLSVDKIVPLADGRVFTGEMAFRYHLVDGIGDYRDALRKASTMAHLKTIPAIREFHKKGVLNSLLSSKVSTFLGGGLGESTGFWSILPGSKI